MNVYVSIHDSIYISWLDPNTWLWIHPLSLQILSWAQPSLSRLLLLNPPMVSKLEPRKDDEGFTKIVSKHRTSRKPFPFGTLWPFQNPLKIASRFSSLFPLTLPLPLVRIPPPTIPKDGNPLSFSKSYGSHETQNLCLPLLYAPTRRCAHRSKGREWFGPGAKRNGAGWHWSARNCKCGSSSSHSLASTLGIQASKINPNKNPKEDKRRGQKYNLQHI